MNAYTPIEKGRAMSLHVSPYAANADDIVFDAIVGHEMIHIRHANIPGIGFNRPLSESVAYRHSYNVYMNAGRWQDAMQMRFNAIQLGFWNVIPPATYWLWH